MATESEVQAAIVQRLRDSGWHVLVTASDKRGRRQVAGLPDVLAFRRDVTLLLECKQPGGRLRVSQRVFEAALGPHLGPHLHHVVAYGERQEELIQFYEEVQP